MKDEYGRTDNRSQTIRSLDKLIAKNPNKYPSNSIEWLEWLNADSGNSIDEF